MLLLFHRISLAKFSAQDFVYLCRIRLALRQLHALTDQETDNLNLAVTVLLRLVGVFCDHLVDEAFECAAVSDLFKSLRLDNRVDIAAVIEHCVEHGFSNFAGYCVVFDALNQHRQTLSLNGRLVEFPAVLVEKRL